MRISLWHKVYQSQWQQKEQNRKTEKRNKFTLRKINEEEIQKKKEKRKMEKEKRSERITKCLSWKVFANYVEGKLVVVEIMAAESLAKTVRNISCAFCTTDKTSHSILEQTVVSMWTNGNEKWMMKKERRTSRDDGKSVVRRRIAWW